MVATDCYWPKSVVRFHPLVFGVHKRRRGRLRQPAGWDEPANLGVSFVHTNADPLRKSRGRVKRCSAAFGSRHLGHVQRLSWVTIVARPPPVAR